MILQTTLCLAAAAIFINLWHFVRIVRLRVKTKISHGDGGDVVLARRMRAQANFIENATLTLVAIAVIDLSGRGGRWLAIAGAVYMLARIAHGMGMDSEKPSAARGGGMMITLIVQIGLAVAAVMIATGHM